MPTLHSRFVTCNSFIGRLNPSGCRPLTWRLGGTVLPQAARFHRSHQGRRKRLYPERRVAPRRSLKGPSNTSRAEPVFHLFFTGGTAGALRLLPQRPARRIRAV